MTKLFYQTLAVSLLLGGCASRSVLPDVNEVKVSRENPPKDCEELGRVTGQTLTTKQTSEDALNDMRQMAAKKGATFLRVEQYSDMGTSVTGTAFKCP